MEWIVATKKRGGDAALAVPNPAEHMQHRARPNLGCWAAKSMLCGDVPHPKYSLSKEGPLATMTLLLNVVAVVLECLRVLGDHLFSY